MGREYEKEATILLYDCKKDLKLEKEEAERIMKNVANLAKVKLIDYTYYQHNGGGISAYSIIEESYIGLETWPEYNLLIVRIASCNPKSDFVKVRKYLINEFEPKETIEEERKIGLKERFYKKVRSRIIYLK
jgi:S-adenosylmethionine/arginine decarboxylase-like enzyme